MLNLPGAPIVAIADPLDEECDIFTVAFQNAGFHTYVLPRESPVDCVAHVARVRPDLVIHRTRPTHTGTAFIMALRSRPETAGIPVIVVTTDTRAHVLEAARFAGANDVLTMPVMPSDLVARAALFMGGAVGA